MNGSLILTVSSLMVSAGNYLTNILLAHQLGPANFADANLLLSIVVTLTFIFTTLSLVTAKFTAIHCAQNDYQGLATFRYRISRLALFVGVLVGTAFCFGSPLLVRLFHFQSTPPFIVLGISIPILNLLAVERGILQGQIRFAQLALSLQLEMWIRLVGTIIVVYLDWSTTGVAFALLVSFAITWLFTRRTNKTIHVADSTSAETYQDILTFAYPLLLTLLGQVLINNSDSVLVKYFYPEGIAGQYAVLALIGRIVFFANWPIVMVLFSVAAHKHEKKEPHAYLLYAVLGLTSVLSALIILVGFAVPTPIIELLFGAAYLPIAPLLWLYAVATALYVFANVIVSYRIALGDSRLTTFVLWASLIQIVLIVAAHDSLLTIVLAQIIAMLGLLSVVILALLIQKAEGSELSWITRKRKTQ